LKNTSAEIRTFFATSNASVKRGRCFAIMVVGMHRVAFRLAFASGSPAK